ncbi:hypothetical protein GFM44_23350 [Rhizobium leguminosarum bv. viciae]|nr:hypothetical protein [Rhizobium leguminosarum bv. viciae]
MQAATYNLDALKDIFDELLNDADARIAHDRNWNSYINLHENGGKGAAWSEEFGDFFISCETVAVGTGRERHLTILDQYDRGHTWQLECVWSDDDRYINTLELRQSHSGFPLAA